ncbi:MAG: hypothetical protein LAT54_03140 [Cryomorphaceae bacterium]|nr:hypothetical protein [Cryomorphaceae bacterium]
MKTQIISLALLATSIAFSSCSKDDDQNNGNENGNGNGNELAYNIGDIGPAGGYVFLIDSANQYDDWSYMEVAPSDWAEQGGKDPNVLFSWGSGLFPNSIGTQLQIGFGLENSNTLEQENRNFPGVSSSLDYELEVNGEVFNDWFLPSVYELEVMYQVLHVNGLGDFQNETNDGQFNDHVIYQSSSVQNGTAWFVNFEIPANGEDRDWDVFGRSASDNRGYVRPVRRF